MYLGNNLTVRGGNAKISHKVQRPIYWFINLGLESTTKVSLLHLQHTLETQEQADNLETESAAAEILVLNPSGSKSPAPEFPTTLLVAIFMVRNSTHFHTGTRS